MAYFIFNNSTGVEGLLQHLEACSLELSKQMGVGLNIKIDAISNDKARNCEIKLDNFKVHSSKDKNKA